MSDELRGVVACHGSLARALIDAVESISGVRGALVAVSNSGCDRGSLEERIAVALDGGSGLLFTDMPSGSCLIAALHQAHGTGRVRVVTGVNLAMLLDFVFHRDLPLDQAAERAAQQGHRAIVVPA